MGSVITRIGAAALVFLLLAVAAGWILFVPSAQEPSYVFVSAWGRKGEGPGDNGGG